MGRYCYSSRILDGQEEAVRNHWKAKEKFSEDAEEAFWLALGMTGFESWLQDGDYIHCLEGESKEKIFSGLREQIARGNPCALHLQDFYLKAFGKDYLDPASEPEIEQLLDLTLPSASKVRVKKGIYYPLLPGKEEAYRKLSKEAAGEKRGRHEAVMKAASVQRLTTWIQTLPNEKRIVVYTERSEAKSRPERCQEWEEIAELLSDQTGLKLDELSPKVEWLTA